MALGIEDASDDLMKPLWFRKHGAEGYVVISHPDYGDVPAWNEAIAMALVALLNYGPRASVLTVSKAAASLNAKET